MVIRQDARILSPNSDIGGEHDAGLEHNHHWACERIGARHHNPVVSDTSSMRTPSSVHHDDAIYSAR